MTGNGAPWTPDLRGVGTPKRSQRLLLPPRPLNSNANVSVQNLSAWARRMLGRVVRTRPALMNLGNFYLAPGLPAVVPAEARSPRDGNGRSRKLRKHHSQ